MLSADSSISALSFVRTNFSTQLASCAAISVCNVDAHELAALIAERPHQLLAVIGFGVPQSPVSLPCGYVSVAQQALADSPPFEVWLTEHAVQHCAVENMVHFVSLARTPDLLFGCVAVQQSDDESLEDITRAAYEQIFDVIDAQQMPHLCRAWHYLPAINSPEKSLERYRRFSLGRHDAFIDKGRTIERDAPAASALGCDSSGDANNGQLVIYFIASATRGTPLENPRQVSAYHYPEHYGPRSPTFARALIAPAPQSVFYVSGTASIVGHETRHIDDARAQTRETIENIVALQVEAKRLGASYSNQVSHMKIYIRHLSDLAAVKEEVDSAFADAIAVEGNATWNVQKVYLQADICRSDLLVEIELVSHAI